MIRKKNSTKRIIFLATILLVGFLFSFSIFKLSFYLQTKNIQAQEQLVRDRYAQYLETQNNANKLVINANRLAKSADIEWSILNLERATKLEPKYRDAWVLLGYTRLKLNEPEKGLEALKTAEKLDPTHKQTYELLKNAYKALGQDDSAKAAEDKYDYLNKK